MSHFARRLERSVHVERFEPWFFGIPHLDSVVGGVRAGFVNLIVARTHVGKRLHEDTPVLTPEGWTPIKNIAVGDEVIGRDGLAHDVTGAFSHPDRPLYRITFGDGTTVDADDEHIWTVRNASKSAMGWFNLTTSEMVAAGVTEPGGKRRFHIPLVEAVDGFAPQSLNDDPYVVGVVLGDGYSKENKDGSVTWRVCTDLEILGAIGATKLKRHETGPYTGTVHTSDLVSGRSWEKVVPTQYLYGSRKQRLGLLQGLLDTDGYPMPTGGVEFCSTSKALVDAVVFLVQSMGGLCTSRRAAAATYTHNGEKRTGRPAERINVKLPADITPFRLRRKLNRWVPPTKYPPTRSIVSIERIPNGPGVCISVDSPDHLYVVKDFIVTHNTHLALAGIRNNPEVPTLFISADDDPDVVVRKMMQFDRVIDDGWKAKASDMAEYVKAYYPSLDIVDNVTWGPVAFNGRISVPDAILKFTDEYDRPPELIVYDYLGIDGSDFASTMQISGWQKGLTKELPMPVLVIAQSNRQGAKTEKGPNGDFVRRGFRVEDLSYGGEQQAGLMIGLTAAESYVAGNITRVIEADVVKNKAVFDGSGVTDPRNPVVLCHSGGRLTDRLTAEHESMQLSEFASRQAMEESMQRAVFD